MTLRKWVVTILCAFSLTISLACKPAGNSTTTNSNSTAETAPSAETGVEKVKPAPGTGNVQGKVVFNGKPVPNIEVKLCETFSRFLSGCGGQIYTARSDADGEYVITNVAPKTYEALTVRVFDTDSYVFATTGIAGLSAAKYDVTADKTVFVSPTHIFKSDLKTTNPKAGSKVNAQGLELKWEAYPDAAYYKVSLYPEDSSVTSLQIKERVEGTTFSVSKPLSKGSYRWQVEAFNSADRKLAETTDDIKFTVTE